ncbi:MAG: preprotein translocase subunit YajC, partial [Clostridiales bacterium]|nr:preprotein translocase subunit YajC [Clostridiales bacterium]
MMGSFMSLGLLVLMFVVFYFILIRPQRKKDKELKEQMSKLSVGDRVITIGGLVGFVAN